MILYPLTEQAEHSNLFKFSDGSVDLNYLQPVAIYNILFETHDDVLSFKTVNV